MSVDDAFRKLMDEKGFRRRQPEGTPEVAGAAVADAPPAAPSASAEPPKPPVEPLDLERIPKVSRFAYTPVDSRSQVAEEYRILRTRLQSLDLSRNSILLTSCHHNEGKTSTALNLSLFLARRKNKKILLVDFDLRRPRVNRMFGIPSDNHDLFSVLRGRCEAEEAMLFSQEDNLYVLGAAKGRASGTDYLENPATAKLIDRMHATFDFIIMDSCPCLSTSDPSILGGHAGGVLMVVRCLQTQRESIQHAINALMEVGVPVQGVILTFMRYFIPPYLYRYQYYHGGSYEYYRSYGDSARESREDEERSDAMPLPEEVAESAGEDEESSVV